VKALLVDFGGVLTTNVFQSFRAFCASEGLDPDALIEVFRTRPEAQEAVRAVETGAISEEEFSARLGGLLGLARTDGLVDRLLAGLGRDEAMVAAVRRARAAGVRTGLVSNSLGTGRYDRSVFPELFDGVVISGEVGLRKPEPEIYLLAAERVGVAPEACVFVDDLRVNCQGAEAVGMTAVLHRGAERTIPRLEELLDVELR
jgi:epoxide hydrolase-like predicted phosphatase